MSSSARDREKAHVFFYRDNYRRAARVLPILLVIMLVQIIIIGYQLFTRPKPDYFVTTMRGDVIRLAPLTQTKAVQSSRKQLQESDHEISTQSSPITQ